MSAVFYIKRNDRGPSLSASLKDASGSAIDLTTASGIKFKMAKATPLDADMVVVNASEGTVRYDWADGDTDTAGVFRAEIEIAWSDGRKQTIPNHGYIKIYIDEDLG